MRAFALLCILVSGCAQMPDAPPGKGPLDPAGRLPSPKNSPLWESPPRNATDLLNTTGGPYPGNWVRPDPLTHEVSSSGLSQ
jgi:hypothetical protein